VTGSGPFGLIAALAITLGLLAMALHLLRRFQSSATGGARGLKLEVVRRVMLGPKQGIALLRVGERVLVVGIAESGISLLTELSGEALADTLKPPAPGSVSGDRWPMLKLPILGKMALIASLALAPLAMPIAARAQMQTPAPATAKGSPRYGAAPIRPPIVHAPVPPKVDIQLGEGKDGLHLSGAVGLVVFLGFLTLLPALFLLMTSFTRILIVLHFLRSALGAQTTPPGQLLVAIAVLLTGVVMNPVLQQTQKTALEPYFAGQITQVQAYQQGVIPFREFMIKNTRMQDITTFAELSRIEKVDSVDQLPTVTIVSAFVTSELRTAFQMGFVIYLPFVVVDVIVASVLMSLGMFMLPPVMVSLPFKLLLFVLADGWTLVVQNLVKSFR
jgi:flagellar biosynthesis protein FliP